MSFCICRVSACVGACACACAYVDPANLSCLSACFLSLPVRLLAAALGDSPAELTWSRLTLAFLNESCSYGHRLRLKCGSLACVITPLACQSLGTSAVCRSHTELGIVLEYLTDTRARSDLKNRIYMTPHRTKQIDDVKTDL